ncbi:MAG: amidase domain-containing protein [Actinomycetota bacterium]|nr:amidase domain-containing protein [Actinomycetota bacterium]
MRKIALVLLVLIVMLSMAPEAFAWSKSSAVSYAETYALSPNNAWPYFDGGDCTNFVSQCLEYGGIAMDTVYTDRSKWYMVKNMFGAWIWGYPWTVAHDFYEYFRTSSRTASYRYFIGSYDWQSATSRPIPPDNNTSLNNGDIVSFNFDGDGDRDHNTIVVAQNSTDWENSSYSGDLVDYHTPNKKHIIWHLEYRIKQNGWLSTATVWAWGLSSSLN